ncbi:MAG: hypothetical protein WKG06_17690 [Segetibacter sp.]
MFAFAFISGRASCQPIIVPERLKEAGVPAPVLSNTVPFKKVPVYVTLTPEQVVGWAVSVLAEESH